jgi:hypothetical protein
MPVILDTWEAEVGRLQPKAALGKSMGPYVKNELKAKEPGAWLKWQSTYLATTKP